ncbi:MAG: hypothetical protein QOD99_1445 [Chthoniobacter sp.]|nr:hypothetical protein [Chthoniobacter sp.]
MTKYFLIFLTACGLGCSVNAGPLQEATLSRIIKDVKVVNPASGARPAQLQEVIKNDLGVKTGAKSRAELLFQDNTLTRLGPETFFSFTPGTRDLTLEQGTMLLQVPKNLGGAKIRTAAVTASITGTTIMMEFLPHHHIKVVVLEGSLRLSLNGRPGEALLLTPGKMIVMNPEARSIPDPVDVDLRQLVQTSQLVDPALFAGSGKSGVPPLPSLGLIQKEISHQDTLKVKADLVSTNLVIPGAGTVVTNTASEVNRAQLSQPRYADVAVHTVSVQESRETAARSAGESDLVRNGGLGQGQGDTHGHSQEDHGNGHAYGHDHSGPAAHGGSHEKD